MATSTASYAGEVQHWQGYWLQWGMTGDMTIELFKASDDRVYGYGCDSIGLFTWKGNFNGNYIHLTKNYLNQHALQYTGEKTTEDTIEGEWNIGTYTGGSFYFERQYTSAKPLVTAYLQEWKGHRVSQKQQGEMNSDMVFTSEGKVYGGGSDDLGSFTWLGNYHKKDDVTTISLVKQYDGRHALEYKGRICQKGGRRIMEGTWIDREGEQDTFCLTASPDVPAAR